MWTGPPIQDGRPYIRTGLSAGLNLSLSMIQEDDVAAAVGQELLSGKLGQAQRAPIRVSHEPVNHVVRVQEKSGDCAVRSNAVDVRTLAWARALTWNVELNERAVPIAHETVIHIFLVNIPSRDRSIGIKSKRVGTLEGAWHVTGVRGIERGEDSFLIHQETVTQIVRVKVVSHYGSIRSKASAKSTLARSGARARNIVCGNDALLVAEETVVRIGRISVESCDLATEADCEGKGTLAGAGARTRYIERGEAAIPISEETVTHEGRVSRPSRDRPVRVYDQRTKRKGALKWPRARARRIEDGNHALIGANVAVEYIDCVTKESRNGSTRVDRVGPCPLTGARARTRRIEDGETAILGSDETVPHIVRVTAESYDWPRRGDVGGIGALKGTRARTRRVKGGNGLRSRCGYRQGDQNDCRWHKLKFPFCKIEWVHTP